MKPEASILFQRAIEFDPPFVDRTKTIFHIDVNSAYLSWTAAYQLSKGATIDLRDIPSVIGGDELSRHGIVLAKSIPAKRFGIQTGNPLRLALEQCPELTIAPPDYHLYNRASQSLMDTLREYSPMVQQFSVDECFVDFRSENYHDPLALAHTIKERVKHELGYTVNIGISTNKLLAKMASEFRKPDRVHTLFPDEIATKMWPLPVEELFMVGRKTAAKLHNSGIMTIGQLAHASPYYLENTFKSFGITLYLYANGIDDAPVRKSNFEVIKGVGNSTTIPFDATTKEVAYKVLLSLCETIGVRLRGGNFMTGVMSISIVSSKFTHCSHQCVLDTPTNATNQLYAISKQLFDELWDNEPIRKLGIRASRLQSSDFYQTSFMTDYDIEKEAKIDKCVDTLRYKFGNKAIYRASFIGSGLKPVNGGVSEEKYPVMTCRL